MWFLIVVSGLLSTCVIFGIVSLVPKRSEIALCFFLFKILSVCLILLRVLTLLNGSKLLVPIFICFSVCFLVVVCCVWLCSRLSAIEYSYVFFDLRCWLYFTRERSVCSNVLVSRFLVSERFFVW